MRNIRTDRERQTVALMFSLYSRRVKVDLFLPKITINVHKCARSYRSRRMFTNKWGKPFLRYLTHRQTDNANVQAKRNNNKYVNKLKPRIYYQYVVLVFAKANQ